MLQANKKYELIYSNGDNDMVTIVGYMNDGWYKVRGSVNQEFFININQVVKVTEW